MGGVWNDGLVEIGCYPSDRGLLHTLPGFNVLFLL